MNISGTTKRKKITSNVFNGRQDGRTGADWKLRIVLQQLGGSCFLVRLLNYAEVLWEITPKRAVLLMLVIMAFKSLLMEINIFLIAGRNISS